MTSNWNIMGNDYEQITEIINRNNENSREADKLINIKSFLVDLFLNVFLLNEPREDPSMYSSGIELLNQILKYLESDEADKNDAVKEININEESFDISVKNKKKFNRINLFSQDFFKYFFNIVYY